MSSTPPSSDARPPEDAAAPAPASVRVSVVVLGVLAALLLVNAGLTWFGREQVAAVLAAAGDIAVPEAMRSLVLWLVVYLVLGLVMATSAWFLPQRRPWARWAALGATVVLVLRTLLSAVASGGITPGSLLLLVLCVAAATSLLSRTTTAWLARPASHA